MSLIIQTVYATIFFLNVGVKQNNKPLQVIMISIISQNQAKKIVFSKSSLKKLVTYFVILAALLTKYARGRIPRPMTHEK